MADDNRAYMGRFFTNGHVQNRPPRGKTRTGGKYIKGERLNAHEAIMTIMAGKSLFWYNKVQNSKWLINSQIRMVVNAANHGILYAAVWVQNKPKKAQKQEETK